VPTALEERLGYTFQNPSLLTLALTHPSCRHEAGGQDGDNQRLEFLGDAVLQMVLTEALYHRFPRWDEGRMTRLRARLVNRSALEALAVKYELGPALILGRGEEMNLGRQRSSNLCDAFEAVAGAIFLDGGSEAAARWVRACFDPVIEAEAAAPDEFNAKGALQEWLQGRGKTTPTYQLVAESGPDHGKRYEVAVVSEGREIGRGSGPSKKIAESQAAAQALENLKA
jgi:ribonuclease-3